MFLSDMDMMPPPASRRIFWNCTQGRAAVPAR